MQERLCARNAAWGNCIQFVPRRFAVTTNERWIVEQGHAGPVQAMSHHGRQPSHMWGESTRVGNNPILIRSGVFALGTDPDDTVREDFRTEGRQDPWSSLLTPAAMVSSLDTWQHDQALPNADI
eukprot:10556954-Alexandrium_andersonii.AAC.1